MPSSRVMASGFSLWTLLPASSAVSATSACAFGMVRFSTISISGSASSSSTVSALQPCSSALALRALRDQVGAGDDVEDLERLARLEVDAADVPAADDADFAGLIVLTAVSLTYLPPRACRAS